MRSLYFLSLLFSVLACERRPPVMLLPQYPSPMVDYTRPHHRVPLDSIPEAGIPIDLPGERRGVLYLPEQWRNSSHARLLIHFHGDGRVAQYAVDRQSGPWVLFHCHWGGGSSAYRRPVEHLGAGPFLDTVLAAVRQTLPETEVSGVYLSGWSAGYGAVRALIGDERAAGRIDGILLLDGLHCSYVPEGKVLAAGGAVDSVQMQSFLHWARLATSGQKTFVYTHSSVFPGTYASTTETADYLLQRLDIPRRPLLAEGPVGMQQTSVAARGKLLILSFAGNSAPDHVDHYHGMEDFLRRLE